MYMKNIGNTLTMEQLREKVEKAWRGEWEWYAEDGNGEIGGAI